MENKTNYFFVPLASTLKTVKKYHKIVPKFPPEMQTQQRRLQPWTQMESPFFLNIFCHLLLYIKSIFRCMKNKESASLITRKCAILGNYWNMKALSISWSNWCVIFICGHKLNGTLQNMVEYTS